MLKEQTNQNLVAMKYEKTPATSGVSMPIYSVWMWANTVSTHVFTTSVYHGLNVKNSPNLSDLWPAEPKFSLLHYDE